MLGHADKGVGPLDGCARMPSERVGRITGRGRKREGQPPPEGNARPPQLQPLRQAAQAGQAEHCQCGILGLRLIPRTGLLAPGRPLWAAAHNPLAPAGRLGAEHGTSGGCEKERFKDDVLYQADFKAYDAVHGLPATAHYLSATAAAGGAWAELMDYSAELRRGRWLILLAVLAVVLLGTLTVLGRLWASRHVEPVVPDDPDAFASRFWEPDWVEAIEPDGTAPGLPQRALVYERKGVRADFTFDPRAKKWSFIGFRQCNSDQPLQTKLAVGLLESPQRKSPRRPRGG